MDIEELCNELNDSLENLLKEESTYFKSKEEIRNSILEEFHITDINEFIKTIDNKEDKEYFENFFDKFNITIDSFLCIYEMVEEMISNSDSLASEILEIAKNNEIDYFDDYIIYYLSEKLNVEKDLVNEKILTIRHAFIENKFDSVKEEFIYKLISKLDNKMIDELIDKSSGFLEELCIISKNNDFSINDLTEDTIKKIISSKICNFINLIPDNMLRELNEELVLELVKKVNYIFLSKEKQVILTSRFSFKTIFLNTEKYLGNESALFSMYDEIDSESFDFIIENKIFSNINNNKFIMSNKEYIKRLIDSGYFKIVLYLNEDMLDDEIINILKSKCSDFGKEFAYNFDTKNIPNLLLFKSKKNLLKIANITYTNFEKFLGCVPEEYLKDVVLFCTLNGMKEPTDIRYQQYYKKDLESIKHALELGYNFSYRTNITTKEKVELFIKRGYGQALDKLLSQKIKVSYELYRAAIENGYKYNDQFNISTIFESENDFCNLLIYLIESNNQDLLLKYMSHHGTVSYNNNLVSYYTYICCNINHICGDMDFVEYLDKNNLLDGILDILIYKYHTTAKLCIEVGRTPEQSKYIDIDEIIKNRYENYKSIYQYLKYIVKIPEFSLNQEDVDKYFDENGYTNELVNYFNQNKEITKNILSNLAHNALVLNNINKDFIDIFKEYIISTFLKDVESPYEKYEYLVNNLGPELLFNLDNPKLKKLLDFDKEQLDKLFNLFDKQTTEIPNERVYSSFVQSLLTFKFKKEKREIVDVFTNINAIIVNTTEEELNNILNNNLDSYLNEWITSISECLELDDTGLIELKNAIKECKYLNEQPLRDICRKFLEKTQKEYYEENKDKVLIELNLPITYDKQDANTKLYNYFLQNVNYENFDLIRKQLKNSFDYENVSGYIEQISMDKSDFELVLNLSKEKFDLIISAIRNKTKPDDSVKKEFSLFKRVISQYSKYIVSNNLADKELINTLNVKKSVKIPLEKIDMISILNELDLDIFINTVGNNEKILSNLNKLFSKYYIGRLPSDMGKNIENKYSITLPGGINNIGLFITRYYQLLLRKQKLLKNDNKNVDIKDIMFTFMELVELISASNSETYELKRLIGTNEYLDFISNKGPNSGQGSRLQREEKMGLIVDYLYSVDSVTIPSGDIIVETGDKKINFIVGNRTNPANICHGERTGACMRVGGVGEGLFLKCITDKNWFHIRIEDPDTHEYVSRVSGFRNGNTVYLNQLRNVPAVCKYTNEDLQMFIEKYAKELIEQTKDSEYPIENVFINGGTQNCYAMIGYIPKNGKTYHLGIDIQKEYNLDGLFDLQVRGTQDIWTDVKNSAVLLATTEEGALTEDGYVPLKNGPEQTEIYPVTRDKIYGLEYVETEEPKYRFVEVSNEDLFEKINRVHCMKAKLLGSDYRFAINDVDELNDDNYMVDGYASADWYVYIDSNKVIHTDFISEIKKKDGIISYAQAKEAQAEMNYYKQMLERKYNLSIEVKYAV